MTNLITIITVTSQKCKYYRRNDVCANCDFQFTKIKRRKDSLERFNSFEESLIYSLLFRGENFSFDYLLFQWGRIRLASIGWKCKAEAELTKKLF